MNSQLVLLSIYVLELIIEIFNYKRVFIVPRYVNGLSFYRQVSEVYAHRPCCHSFSFSRFV